MSMMKSGNLKKYRFGIVSLAVVFLLGLKHLMDVRSGIAQSGHAWQLGQYLFLLAGCLAAIGGIGYMLKSKFRLEHIYLAAGLLFGFMYMLVLPPLSAPDEISHYISAYQLSNRMMGKQSNYKSGHVLIRSEDWFIEDVYGSYRYQEDDGILVYKEDGEEQTSVLGQTLTEETYRILYEMGLKHADRGAETLAVSTYPPVVTTPAAYIPQALGISLARLFGLNSLGLLYLGRLFNLLFFVGVTWLAMRRMPFGKEVLFAVTLLPMSLHLSASFSYDVILMAGVFYFAAYCLELAYARPSVRAVDVIVLAAIMALVGPCKIVYAVFMGLCLLIPVSKFGGWRRWFVAAMVVAGSCIFAMLLVNGQTISTYAAETDAVVPWAEEAGYSLTLLIHNPRLLFEVFYSTIIWQAQHYHLTLIGAYLGNLDVVLDVPYVAVVLLTGCLLAVSFKKPGESVILSGRSRLWIGLLCAACAGGLMLSMLIAWTPLSTKIIKGVQGRYFLPFLPLLLMICKNNYIVLTKNIDRTILYLMCCINGYVLLRLFSIVCIRI